MLSWTPIRHGDRYCAPACGYGCTYADYRAAVKAAAKLAHTMGPDWSPGVWENLGWHYYAVSRCGRWKISSSVQGKPSYTASLSAPSGTGACWMEHASTPQGAFHKVKAVAGDELARIASLLNNPPTNAPLYQLTDKQVADRVKSQRKGKTK